VDTADGEARDITSFVSGSAARDSANKDVARTESLLQLPSRPTLTKLSMAGGEDAAFFVRGAGQANGVCAVGADIATLNDIHAAYIRGSVPTAAQESDDILNQPFSDEVVWLFTSWCMEQGDAQSSDAALLQCSGTGRTARRRCPTRTSQVDFAQLKKEQSCIVALVGQYSKRQPLRAKHRIVIDGSESVLVWRRNIEIIGMQGPVVVEGDMR
jgi:hypothetical protein